MRTPIHNVSIKKETSELFETNALSPQVTQIEDYIQPTKVIEPIITVFKTTSSSGTFYTTPTDKQFFLTGLSMMTAGNDVTHGTISLTLIPKDGLIMTFLLYSSELTPFGSNSLHIPFPYRGLKGSNHPCLW